MAFDPGAIDSTLAAAVGDDAGLIAELRDAFLESAGRLLDMLVAARDRDSWILAASRLKGLSASFGAVRLMVLADQASAGVPFDAIVLGKIRRSVARL